MLRWFSRSSSTDAAPENHSPSEEEEEAVPPPVPLRLGVPMHACCLAVDPMQGTIAVGNSYGDVQLFGTGGTEVQLPPPSSAETKPFAPAVMSLLWDINEGRLVVVHAPNLVRVWCIRGVAARLTASLRVGRAKSAVVVATMPPRSGGLSLFGTVDMAVAACDVTRGRTSHWSLDVSSGGDEAAGGGALCALELRPADPALRLLVAVHAGALRVFRLGGKGGGEASAPLLLGSHPEGVPLWCAAWLCDGLSDGLGALVGAGGVAGSVAAGYANGDVLTFSLRGQGAPAAALQLTAVHPGPGAGPSSSTTSTSAQADSVESPEDGTHRRSVRWIQSTGATLLVAGGTSIATQPDGLVVLRGPGFGERSLLAPPRGGVLAAATSCTSTSPPTGQPPGQSPSQPPGLLPNGAPAQPERLVILATTGQLYTYSLRTMGAAPRRLPDGLWVESKDAGAPQVRLALTALGGGRILAALCVSKIVPVDDLAMVMPPRHISESGTVPSETSTDSSTSASTGLTTQEQQPGGGAAPVPRVTRLEPPAEMARPAQQELTTPFYNPTKAWPDATNGGADGGGGGFLGGAARWLQQEGAQGGGAKGAAAGGTATSGSSGLALAGKLLGDGLNWASKELAKQQEAARAAPADNLRQLLFPTSEDIDVSDGGFRASAAQRASATAEANRSALLGSSSGGGGGRPLTTRERVEARLAAHRAAKGGSATERAMCGASGAASSLHETLNAMHERGDKLNQLGDKSAKLADDAADFADLAKQLRKQQQGFFGGLF